MRTLRLLTLLMMLMMPIKAQAAITWDFSAIAGTIQSVVTNVKIKIDRVKANVMEWKIVQSLGSAIKSVSAFFQDLKTEYEKQKRKYLKWKKDIKKFIKDAEAFYAQTIKTIKSALATAEYIAETGARFQAYFNEGKSIIKGVGDTVELCGNNLVELVRVVKHAKEEWAKLQDNINKGIERRNQLQKKMDNLRKHEESNAVTNEIRNLSDQLSVELEKIDNFKRTLHNIEKQIDNHIASQKNLITSCKRNIMVLKARTKRLICNMTSGELKGFEKQVNSLGNNLNKWNKRLESLQTSSEQLSIDFEKNMDECLAVCDDCKYGNKMFGLDKHSDQYKANRDAACRKCNECKPGEPESVIEVTTIPHNSPNCQRQLENMVSGPDKGSCRNYKKLCENEANGDACVIACSSLCESLPADDARCCMIAWNKCESGHDGYCENLDNDCPEFAAEMRRQKEEKIYEELKETCQALEKQCEEERSVMVGSTVDGPVCKNYKSKCGDLYSFNYTISTSSPIAYAFTAGADFKQGGTNEEGIFMLPNNWAFACQLNADTVLLDNSYSNCIARFNALLDVKAGTPIDEDNDTPYFSNKTFFQALRKGVGEETIQASDSNAAGSYLTEGYAESLASAYLEAMQIYNESFTYTNDQTSKTATTPSKEIQTSWDIVIDLNLKVSNRLNQIKRLWSRELLNKSIAEARGFKTTVLEAETNAE